MIALSRFQQTLVGSYRLSEADREQPLTLELRATRPSLLPKLAGRLEVEGEIDAKGVADRRPVHGRISLNAWIPFATRYELELDANDGRHLLLNAERRPQARSPFWSVSTVEGEIRDAAGVLVAHIEVRLDYRRGLSGWLGR